MFWLFVPELHKSDKKTRLENNIKIVYIGQQISQNWSFKQYEKFNYSYLNFTFSSGLNNFNLVA